MGPRQAIVHFLQTSTGFGQIFYRLERSRAEMIVARIEPYLTKQDAILDIGTGLGTVAEVLLLEGYDVTPLDVEDLCFVDSVRPIVYEGGTLPFADNSLDVGLALLVLHHVERPEEFLTEIKRVCKKLVIIEDIYTSVLHKRLTFLVDDLINLKFVGHPHSNKPDDEWRRLFAKLGLDLRDAQYYREGPVFSHVVYYLENSREL